MAVNSTQVSFEQESYEMEDLWRPDNIAAADAERVAVLATRIPEDVRSVLDVGCGGGIFLNFLSTRERKYDRLCGVDRAQAALKYVRVEKREASIDALPFRDGEFDLVACLEVLEHLPLNIYDQAIREITRVGKRYVLLSVPNEEDLDAALVTCPYCRTRYSADYHMRRYDEATLAGLLHENGFTCGWTSLISPRQRVRHLFVLKLWRALKARPPPWYAVCPVCGFRNPKQGEDRLEPPELKKNALKRMLKSWWPKEMCYRWLMALYSRH